MAKLVVSKKLPKIDPQTLAKLLENSISQKRLRKEPQSDKKVKNQKVKKVQSKHLKSQI